MRFFPRAPDIGKLTAKRDLEGLLKAAQNPEAAADVKQAATEAAVIVALQIGNSHAIHATVRALALRGMGGDDIAIAILARILSGDFDAYGDVGMIPKLPAGDALAEIGPRAIPSLLPLLDHPNWIVTHNAVGVLGRARDLSILDRIVALGLRSSDVGSRYRKAGQAEETWDATPAQRINWDVRSACFTACLNLFSADRDGYVAAAQAMGEEERKFLAAAAGYVSSGLGSSTGGDIAAGRLADKIYQRPRPASTTIALTLDSREVRPGEDVTGTVLLRTKDDRPRVRVADAALSVQLDGIEVAKATTDSKGGASISVRMNDLGRHVIKVVFRGLSYHGGGGYMSAQQSQGIDVVSPSSSGSGDGG